MKSLKGMSILVTGGGSGIGFGTARYCIERGAKVTICGRREDKIQAAAAELVTPVAASRLISPSRPIGKNYSRQPSITAANSMH